MQIGKSVAVEPFLDTGNALIVDVDEAYSGIVVQKLSERRAQSIVSCLTTAGVDAKMLAAVGYGETRPVAPNDTPENRAKNRRIEFTVKAN